MLGADLLSEVDFRDYHLGAVGARGTDMFLFARFLTGPAMALSHLLLGATTSKSAAVWLTASRAARTVRRHVTLLNSTQMGGAFGGDFALLDIASAQEAFNQVGHLSQIDLHQTRRNRTRLHGYGELFLPMRASAAWLSAGRKSPVCCRRFN